MMEGNNYYHGGLVANLSYHRRVSDVGQETTGIGRFSWIYFDRNNKNILLLITFYQFFTFTYNPLGFKI